MSGRGPRHNGGGGGPGRGFRRHGGGPRPPRPQHGDQPGGPHVPQHGEPHEHQGHHQAHAAPPPPSSGAPPSLHMSDTSFRDLVLTTESQRALAEVLKFTRMTKVQEATLPVIMKGGDVMAKAKTGTGKTMAFLIPAIESLRAAGAPPAAGTVSVLVISPTRELAQQIAAEATSLLTHHHPYRVQCVFGGTNIKSEKNRLARERLDFLIATPGRLIDHLTNSDLAPRLSGLRFLVLDEADQLLEMGFRPDVERILSFLPRQRQTLLFSATLPQQVMKVAGLALKQDHAFIDTVGEEDADTNIQVKQSVGVVPLEHQFEVVHAILAEQRRRPDHKVIVFLTTARLTQYYAELMSKTGIPVLEIHSRKSQAQRTKTSDQFRSSRAAIMFSSDVSARGVDYPDITLVLQVGIPSSREQYVHRLGRTGRAGKEGEGILLLSPDEEFFLRELKDLPIARLPDATAQPPAQSVETIRRALTLVEERTASMAYQAWLGYYNSVRGLRWDKPQLVAEANRFSAIMGLDEPPALLKKTIGMMGLRGVPGLRVESGRGPEGGGGGGRGRGGGRGQQGGRPAPPPFQHAPPPPQPMKTDHTFTVRLTDPPPMPPRPPVASGGGGGGGRGNRGGGGGQPRPPKPPSPDAMDVVQQDGDQGGAAGGGGGRRPSRRRRKGPAGPGPAEDG